MKAAMMRSRSVVAAFAFDELEADRVGVGRLRAGLRAMAELLD
jgi:hypothetical protein